MMLRLEFHCHTIYSKDSLTRPADLLNTARRRGIDRLIITDHNTIAGARSAYAIDPQRVIIGEEIKTQKGELLAAFVSEEVPAGLPPLEAIARLREQNAFISVSHPFDHFRNGAWALSDLQEIAPLVDALEVFNARVIWPHHNRMAADFARLHGLPGTVGSDAHALIELGAATLLTPDFHDAAGLKAVLPQAQSQVRLSPPWIHLYSRYAIWMKKNGRVRPE